MAKEPQRAGKSRAPKFLKTLKGALGGRPAAPLTAVERASQAAASLEDDKALQAIAYLMSSQPEEDFSQQGLYRLPGSSGRQAKILEACATCATTQDFEQIEGIGPHERSAIVKKILDVKPDLFEELLKRFNLANLRITLAQALQAKRMLEETPEENKAALQKVEEKITESRAAIQKALLEMMKEAAQEESADAVAFLAIFKNMQSVYKQRSQNKMTRPNLVTCMQGLGRILLGDLRQKAELEANESAQQLSAITDQMTVFMEEVAKIDEGRHLKKPAQFEASQGELPKAEGQEEEWALLQAVLESAERDELDSDAQSLGDPAEQHPRLTTAHKKARKPRGIGHEQDFARKAFKRKNKKE